MQPTDAPRESERRQKGRTHAIRASALALFVGGSAVFVSGALQQTASDRAAERLDEIASQFANLHAVAFESDVAAQFSIAPHPDIATDTLIEGSFSYAAHGDKWRKRSYLDAASYPEMDTETAYDGTFYQNHMLSGPDDKLSIAVGNDEQGAGMTLYNPLFLYAQFLVPLNEGSDDVLLRHVRDAAQTWDGSAVQWSPVLSPYGKAHKAVLPGAIFEGQSFEVHVILPTDESAPIIMDAAYPDGTLLVRTTFSEYETKDMYGQTQRWPKRVAAELYMGTGSQIASLVMDLHNLKTGVETPDDPPSYLLDWDEATHVWADDEQVLIR